jgi:hypothetical protein
MSSADNEHLTPEEIKEEMERALSGNPRNPQNHDPFTTDGLGHKPAKEINREGD